MRGCEMYQIGEEFEKDENIGMRDLVYCAAKMAHEARNLPVTFNAVTVQEWLDSMSDADYDGMMKALDEAKINGQKAVSVAEKKKP